MMEVGWNMFFRKYKRRIEELEKELERVKDRTKELGDENDRIERILKNSEPGEITYNIDCNYWRNSFTLYLYTEFREYIFNDFAPLHCSISNIDLKYGDLSNIIFANIICIVYSVKKKITCVLNLEDLSFCKIGEEDIE